MFQVISKCNSCISNFLKGLSMLREAEQYLAQAQWVVLQTPNCDPAIKSQLYRDLGLLFIAQGNASEAKKHFAEDVSIMAINFEFVCNVSLLDLSFFCCTWTTSLKNSRRILSFGKCIPYGEQAWHNPLITWSGKVLHDSWWLLFYIYTIRWFKYGIHTSTISFTLRQLLQLRSNMAIA